MDLEVLKQLESLTKKIENYKSLLDDLVVTILEGAYEPSERGAGYTCTDEAYQNALDVLILYNVEVKGPQQK